MGKKFFSTFKMGSEFLCRNEFLSMPGIKVSQKKKKKKQEGFMLFPSGFPEPLVRREGGLWHIPTTPYSMGIPQPFGQDSP